MVVRAGPNSRQLAVNSLGEPILATPRSRRYGDHPDQHHVFAVGDTPPDSPAPRFEMAARARSACSHFQFQVTVFPAPDAGCAECCPTPRALPDAASPSRDR